MFCILDDISGDELFDPFCIQNGFPCLKREDQPFSWKNIIFFACIDFSDRIFSVFRAVHFSIMLPVYFCSGLFRQEGKIRINCSKPIQIKGALIFIRNSFCLYSLDSHSCICCSHNGSTGQINFLLSGCSFINSFSPIKPNLLPNIPVKITHFLFSWNCFG